MNVGIASAAACAMFVASTAVADVDGNTITSIERYCAASWQQAGIASQDWEDCTQQVFLDLLQRTSRDRLAEAIHQTESRERRELNRAIWAAVQRWRRAHRHHCLGDDPADLKQIREQDVQEMREALVDLSGVLTPRQRQIVSSSLYGATVAEISRTLDVPAPQISDDKYRAIQKLRREIDAQGHSLTRNSRNPVSPGNRVSAAQW
jgi:DNA-directed RNA polymerase specialized sigma24 family protein